MKRFLKANKKAAVKDSFESTSTAETSQAGDEAVIPCKICGKMFSRTGLGGHTSKAHPNESSAYMAKM